MVILYPQVKIDGDTITFTDGGRNLKQDLPKEEIERITKEWYEQTMAEVKELWDKLPSIDETKEAEARGMLLALALASVPQMDDPITYLTDQFNKWMNVWEETFIKNWTLTRVDELREYGCIYFKHKTPNDGAYMEDELKTLFEVKGRLLGLALSNPRDITSEESPFEYSTIEFNNTFEWLEYQMRDYLIAKLIRECNGAYEEEY